MIAKSSVISNIGLRTEDSEEEEKYLAVRCA